MTCMRSAVLGWALSAACAGSPIEVDPGVAEGSASGSASAEATTAATDDASASASNGDPTSDPTADPTEDPTSDPSGEPTTDPTATDDGATTATVDDTTSATDDPNTTTQADTAEGGSSTGDPTSGGPVGGCNGAPLPEVAPPSCSVESLTEVNLTIENDCEYAVEVFWVGYDCTEESYGIVQSGDAWFAETYETHPWRLRDAATGDLLLEIEGLIGDTGVVLE